MIAYLRDVADDHGLRGRIRFGTEVASARYDESAQRWTVRTTGGEALVADVVITAAGQLNRPKLPPIRAWARSPGRSSTPRSGRGTWT